MIISKDIQQFTIIHNVINNYIQSFTIISYHLQDN